MKPSGVPAKSLLENRGTGSFRRWSPYLWLGISCWLLLIFFHQRHYDYPTPVSRLDLIMAICLERRLDIDSFQQNTCDKALINGHFYSDKAPGTVAIALIGAAPAIWIGRALGWTSQDKRLWLAASWAGCAVLDVILAAGFVCLVRLLWAILLSDATDRGNEAATPGKLPENEGCAISSDAAAEASQILSVQPSIRNEPRSFKLALATAVFIIFGGMAWPYATMMYSHGETIGSISIGLWFLYRTDPSLFSLPAASLREGRFRCGTIPIRPWSIATLHSPLFWSGFAFGWALNSEYTTGLVVFGVPLILFGNRWRNWVPFVAGIGGPCLLIPLYSWATIGVPWKLPYSYQAAFPEMKEGLYAIRWPDAMTAWNLLFSPERGLVFWCPFVAIGLVGCVVLARQNTRVFFLTYLVAALQLIIISGRVWDWPAGPSFSARYLAPIVPLLAIPCGFGLRLWPRTGSVLGLASVFLTGLITVTDATPHFDVANPLFILTLPKLLNLDFNSSLTPASVPRFIGPLVFASACPLLLWIAPNRWVQKLIAERGHSGTLPVGKPEAREN